MATMEWRTPNGCASCRPAVNYYLLSTWPKEARDDPQSRYINERSHANIQKDGTYSVIPRMWGGETTADELRRIADVVDKYKIPTVKVTGGQRIDLLGVKKEDLPGVWKDIGMPSGHAYAKALRTVKTCVGSEWCRFGTQDSTQMGKDLERALWRMYAPHKVKLAVSGCPRNCAEAGIKDVGVIGVDSGWELYVGGNGGIKTEVAQFFCKVKTSAEVLEYSRRLPAAVPRGRLVPGTHGALHQPRRPGPREEEGPGRPRGPQGAVGAPAVQPGRRARSLVRVRQGQRRHAPVRQAGRPWSSRHEARRLDRDLPGRGHPGAGLAPRGAPARRRRRGVPQRPGPGVRAARSLPAQGRPAVAGHRVRHQRGLPAAQLDHRPGRRLRQGARRGLHAALRLQGRRRRVLLDPVELATHAIDLEPPKAGPGPSSRPRRRGGRRAAFDVQAPHGGE
jgi:hypothetical protein